MDIQQSAPNTDSRVQGVDDAVGCLMDAAAAMRLAESLLQRASVHLNSAVGIEPALDVAWITSEQHELTLKVQRGASHLQAAASLLHTMARAPR